MTASERKAAGTARDQILGGVRRALKRSPLDAAAMAVLQERTTLHARNLVPARAASLGEKERRELFVAMAEEVQTTLSRVTSLDQVPEAVSRYLASENLPAELALSPDPALDAIPWSQRPLLRLRRGRAEQGDAVSLTPCCAAIAETGTLMLVSGPRTPTTLNFMPDTHIVLVHAHQIVAGYEDAWDRLRALGAAMPRTVNLVTGPSRTGDIEQRIQLGAHGPRRLHIVLIEGDSNDPMKDGRGSGDLE